MTLPARWRTALAARLGQGESVAAWLEMDLDERLQFREGLLVLTDRRLLHVAPAGPAVSRGGDGGPPEIWREWPNSSATRLTLRDRPAVCSLELMGPSGREGCWYFAPGRSGDLHRFQRRFETRRTEPADETTGGTCEGCGTPVDPGVVRCPRCLQPEPARAASSLFRLARFARHRSGIILASFLLTLATTAVGLIPPYLTIPLLNDVLIPRQHFHLVKWYLLALTGASVLAWLLDWARTYVVAWVSERIACDLRNTVYAHLQRLSLEFFGGRRTGDLISRVGSDTDRICNFLSINVLDFGTDVIMLGMTSALMLWTDPLLAAVTLTPLPLISWLVYVVRARLRRSLHHGSRAWAEMMSVLADTIPGVRVVKAFAQEGREIQRFRQSNDRVLHANDRVNTTWAFFGPLVNLLTQSGLLVIWAFGSWQVFERRLDVGVLVGFQFLINRFYIRLESMIRMVNATQRAANSAHRLFEILDRAPSVAEPARPVTPRRLRGEIAFRGVGFRHGTRAILHDIDLNIRPGEMVGLVGPSGAGKSTLVNLVCRFYDVSEGEIRIDGVDIRSYALTGLRKHVGIVLQDPFLFFGTVAENIAYGKPDATREEIIAAAEAAHCHEFILRLPDGYDSIVGERGQSLSGGERQRISIARALLIDPRILILDEATSSVDNEVEREIQAALDNLIQGRTTIAIAHRLTTVRKADRLIVMEHGRIVQTGRHDELINIPGPYARLHAAQSERAVGAASGV